MTPTLSDAVALNVTVPDTGAPPPGAERLTVGFVVSRENSELNLLNLLVDVTVGAEFGAAKVDVI